jgi:hypothetical protein
VSFWLAPSFFGVTSTPFFRKSVPAKLVQGLLYTLYMKGVHMNRIFFLMMVVSGAARAEAVFDNWQVSGNACNSNTVFVVANGGSVSVLFDGYNVEMLEGEKKDRKNNLTCELKMQVTPPPGMELDGFAQLFSGGIIKSSGASARLKIQYKLANAMNSQEIAWPAGRAITPEDAESVFFKNYNDPVPSRNCKARSQYHLKLHLQASRKATSDFLVGGLDSLDADVSAHLELKPKWRPCRR